MLGLKAPGKDEHGDFLFLLQMNMCTVVFLHLSGPSVRRHCVYKALIRSSLADEACFTLEEL